MRRASRAPKKGSKSTKKAAESTKKGQKPQTEANESCPLCSKDIMTRKNRPSTRLDASRIRLPSLDLFIEDCGEWRKSPKNARESSRYASGKRRETRETPKRTLKSGKKRRHSRKNGLKSLEKGRKSARTAECRPSAHVSHAKNRPRDRSPVPASVFGYRLTSFLFAPLTPPRSRSPHERPGTRRSKVDPRVQRGAATRWCPAGGVRAASGLSWAASVPPLIGSKRNLRAGGSAADAGGSATRRSSHA